MDVLSVVTVARRRFMYRGLFRHLEDAARRVARDTTPTTGDFYRPPAIAAATTTVATVVSTFDVQFPFANEASALTCKRAVRPSQPPHLCLSSLFLSLSVRGVH